jgi:hypothetical protein
MEEPRRQRLDLKRDYKSFRICRIEEVVAYSETSGWLYIVPGKASADAADSCQPRPHKLVHAMMRILLKSDCYCNSLSSFGHP